MFEIYSAVLTQTKLVSATIFFKNSTGKIFVIFRKITIECGPNPAVQYCKMYTFAGFFYTYRDLHEKMHNLWYLKGETPSENYHISKKYICVILYAEFKGEFIGENRI